MAGASRSPARRIDARFGGARRLLTAPLHGDAMTALDAAYLGIVVAVGVRELWRAVRRPTRPPRIRYHR